VPDDGAAGKREPGPCGGVFDCSGPSHGQGLAVRAVPLAAVIPSRVPGPVAGAAWGGSGAEGAVRRGQSRGRPRCRVRTAGQAQEAASRQDTAVPAPPAAPPAKKVATWILTPPGKLADDDRTALAQITSRCEELTATRDPVREFAYMPCHRDGEHLEAWASQAEASPVSELRGFAKGLRKDWAAVTAGLTVPCSSGAVEGHVNF
jgi:hypothetical protein